MVDWTGPNEENDHVTVSRIDSPDHRNVHYCYTRVGSPVSLTMPADPGPYELRYVLDESRQALARKPITVTPVTASLDAPDNAAAGADVAVVWTGPDYKDDYIVVARIGSGGHKHIHYTYTRKGPSLMVQMPSEPGQYELRYIMAQGRSVLGTRPITVSDISASLSAPDSAAAGATIAIGWNGPDYKGDFLTVASPDMPDNKYVAYAYITKGTPLPLQMPANPGVYELRYVTAQDRRVLVRKPIDITAISTTLTVPDHSSAGGMISVQWAGPDYPQDFIALADPGMPDNKYVTYAYTSKGTPLNVEAPLTPGTYELRYILGQDQSAAARTTLTIDPVTASLDAADSAVAGSQMQVT